MSRQSNAAIWNYFEKKDGESKLATCNFCKKTFSFKTTTYNLKTHLKKGHITVYNNFVRETGTSVCSATQPRDLQGTQVHRPNEEGGEGLSRASSPAATLLPLLPEETLTVKRLKQQKRQSGDGGRACGGGGKSTSGCTSCAMTSLLHRREDAEMHARVWVRELERMEDTQALLAKKAMYDILMEGRLGRLRYDGIGSEQGVGEAEHAVEETTAAEAPETCWVSTGSPGHDSSNDHQKMDPENCPITPTTN